MSKSQEIWRARPAFGGMTALVAADHFRRPCRCAEHAIFSIHGATPALA
jgi:hypothetical protein